MRHIRLEFTVADDGFSADVISQQLADIGYDSFEFNYLQAQINVRAYIPESDFDESASLNELGIHASQSSFEALETQNWNTLWEQSYHPVTVDNDVHIRASFHPKRDDVRYDLVIDPKMAFGTGHHETTHLMISELLSSNLRIKKVLDMGCGSGILSILACKLGGAVTAFDICEHAVLATKENATKNFCTVAAFLGGSNEAKKSGQKFDIILANINLNVILEQLNDYKTLLAAGGTLLVSGFLASDLPHLISESAAFAFRPVNTRSRQDWALIRFE